MVIIWIFILMFDSEETAAVKQLAQHSVLSESPSVRRCACSIFGFAEFILILKENSHGDVVRLNK